jgi:uncharacterized cofD-like protein
MLHKKIKPKDKIRDKHIVVIGGGTGTSVVLEGLKKYPVQLSAIITTADDGSSSGVLREQFQMIPPGDIRQCLVALAAGNFGYLNERFQKGFLQGHTLGNLLITLFHQKSGNFQEALDELLKLVGAQGSLIPMTLKPATLVATFTDGRELRGEKHITVSREIGKKLSKLSLFPNNVRANPRAISAIKSADAIVVGPGNLFSSILPNFLVPEIREAVKKSKVKKIYVANLFTQPGHTDKFTIQEFLETLKFYIGEDIFTHIVYHPNVIPFSMVAAHKNRIICKQLELPSHLKKDRRFVGRSIFSSSARKHNVSDPIAQIRNPFLHDSSRLAKALISLL